MPSKTFFQTISPLAAAAVLTACSAPPKADSALTLAATGKVMSTEEAAQRYDINGDWWEIYQDSGLNAVMQQALDNNADLKQAAISVNKALYEANILGADLVPGFNASLSANTTRNLKEGGHSENFSSQLGLSYELDLWRKLSAKADAQVWEYQATREDLANTRLTLANNVADTYFNIAYLNRAIGLTKKNIARYQEIDRIARAKYRHGKADSATPTQAGQSLLSAQDNLISLEASRESLIQTLRNLLNLKPDEDFAADPQTYRLPADAGVRLEVPITVLANRPDLRAAEYRLQSALSSQKAQYRSWYPTITLGASLSTSSNRARSTFNVPMLGGSVQVNLPFLDWKTLKWQDKTAEANFENAKINFEKTLTSALNEVADYYVRYTLARSGLENQAKRLVLDKKNSRYYQVRHQHGKSELKDWLEALNTEFSSEQNVLNRQYEALKYENMVYKAMAGRYTPK
ncbi:MAG: TolC family protein [Neisseria sp.]|nr:TolC family protein [Neisseria sp.]